MDVIPTLEKFGIGVGITLSAVSIVRLLAENQINQYEYDWLEIKRKGYLSRVDGEGNTQIYGRLPSFMSYFSRRF